MAAAALLVTACGQRAETRQSEAVSLDATAVVATSGSTPTEDRDPNAIKALETMSAYLQTLTTFQIRSETSRDEVLDDGQKVAFDGIVDMLVQRPNRLRAEVTSDRQQRFYFYDGTSFTLWARRVNYYATVPAPPTIVELADRLNDRYGLEMPLLDLFYWGSDRKDTGDITGSKDVGASQVEGVSCEHYAFRQPGIDWQLWIQQGDFPLPRKLVITTTSDDARPQFASVMTWNLAPSYNGAAFMFDPPKDAQRITFQELPADPPGR
jgi:hypothetical protein